MIGKVTLSTSLLIVFGTFLGHKTSIAQSSSNEHFIQYHNLFSAEDNDQIACYRIPSIVTANNGDLIAAIDERVPSCGDLKWSEDINIVIRRSSDDGATWSSIERIIDFPQGKSASDPSMIVDQVNGTIFMFYNYMDLINEKDVYYLHLIKSMDHGKTWSEPIDISAQITKPVWKNDFKFITSGRGIQTQDGTLLHCLVNLDHGMHVFGSDDYGETWTLKSNAIWPANESKIIELSDGSWMINSRIRDKGNRYIHHSVDKGKSWQSRKDTFLIDPSCNAAIIKYPAQQFGTEKDLLIFANASSADKRENMKVKYSGDNGLTWSTGKTIYAGSSAYSSLTILENGDIGLFFEKDGYKENVFVSFPLAWILE